MAGDATMDGAQNVVDEQAAWSRALWQRITAAKHAAGSPLFHYSSTFDAIEVMCRHAVKDPEPSPRHLTNFLGVKVLTEIFPPLKGREGQIEAPPVPGNWHADIAEWGAALRAVDLAGATFRVIELGCGWGCWLNITGSAARRTGRRVELIGIEGDLGHIDFALRTLSDNGFTPEQYRIIHGIAAPNDGHALFPIVEDSSVQWGAEPIFTTSPEERARRMASGKYSELRSYSLASLSHEAPVDLLHIDIQGGETAFVASARAELLRLVRYMVIGTHSRQIDGRLMEMLLEDGWCLEMERPAQIGLGAGRPFIRVDGVQGWRNPRLAPL